MQAIAGVLILILKGFVPKYFSRLCEIPVNFRKNLPQTKKTLPFRVMSLMIGFGLLVATIILGRK
jgi:hypothetical protein